jgi:hypothetical protein
METNSSNEIKDCYSLSNFDNYYKNFYYKPEEVIEKYILLSNEFLDFILEKIKFKNTNYSKFIIIRGYETITNIFNIILYYTKNLDLTIYHCQKGYYYYIEFIQQISNVDHVLLQLNSRDATTYVYKKTLTELNHDIKKNFPSCSNIIKNSMEIIDEHIKTFKNIFELILQFLDLHPRTFEILNETNEINLLINKKVIDKFKLICQKIVLINLKTHNNIKIVKNIYNEIENINNNFLNLYTLKMPDCVESLNVNDVENIITCKEKFVDEYFKFIMQKLK